MHPFRRMALLALLLPLLFCACRSPEAVSVRLYERNGPKLMEIQIQNLSRHGAGMGLIAYQAADGEVFKGNWLKVRPSTTSTSPGDTDSAMNYSLPLSHYSVLGSDWGRDSELGIDFDNLTSDYGIFMISGNHGTRLDGIFVFNGTRLDWTHIVGTAKDNKGNKYRVIGPVA
jgi:hypothetical protein